MKEWGDIATVPGPATTHDFGWIMLRALRSLHAQEPKAMPLEMTCRVRSPLLRQGEFEDTQAVMVLIQYEVLDEQP